MAVVVEEGGELFAMSDGSEEEAGRRMFSVRYLSSHSFIKPSRHDSCPEPNMPISANQVLEALRRIPDKHWKNTGRANVRPDGVETIDSLTLGLVSCASTAGMPLPSRSTRLYPGLCRMLLRFWKQHLRQEHAVGRIPGCQALACTSIQLNRNYAARPHVDGNNLGPSWITAVGDWSFGGELFVESAFGSEKHVLEHDIPPRYRKGEICMGRFVNVQNCWARFDGRAMHFVRPFEGGDRFSLVFFCSTRHTSCPLEARSYLEELGFRLPPTRHSPFTEECHCNDLPSAMRMDDEGRLFDITPRLCTSSGNLTLWQEPPVKRRRTKKSPGSP
ncbi:unnamed protein product [Symbiodinium necroappetens]|uniref:Uncharacterized protein n=1 Tax=Symbiodinium necroappetens TaxID=1628268 RepID=A0A813CIE0_9DINO|nr:unnamed protein product [Symbiodinium necroappetens]